jgi:hypothetical protein
LELEDHRAFEKSGQVSDKVDEKCMEKVSSLVGIYMPIISKPAEPPAGGIE